MRKIIYLTFIVCLSFSCTDHDNPGRLTNTCSVDNPVENLPWLKQKISEMETATYSYLVMGTYAGETVFVFDNCCDLCDIMILVYNCDGQIINGVGIGEVGKKRTIWKPKDFVCNQ